MAVLSPAQRNQLEKAVSAARKLAELGAANALRALAVHESEPYAHMGPEQHRLRKLLQAKARLLGDSKLENGRQDIGRLSYELAYEYWHKMLFSAFLEANHLLMHPSGVPVSFQEVEELAPAEDYPNKWVAAAHYASAMLPAIFRVYDPLMQVEYASNDRIALESLLDALDPALFQADDALGWVYQYWQSEAKTAINSSGEKIDGEKLPAVTQLFTEHYMVQFLIDNTIGAWWTGRHPGQAPPVRFEYLRLLDDGRPAAGTFGSWPARAADITCMDPCMGSGHFITSLFQVLVPIRMQEEGLSREEACDRVIAENLHGLELDPRCTQIAAFNLALTAWKHCGRYRPLPEMNLACSGLAPKGREEDWVKLVGRIGPPDLRARMENGMRALYRHFQLAPELGSLLDPAALAPDAFTASYRELKPVLQLALEDEADRELLERGVMAAGIARAGQLLTRKYALQITNVPYLSRGKQDKTIADFCLTSFAEAKGDLATVFLEKMLQTTTRGGTSCSVIPQNWLFLTSYRKYRERLLKNENWNLIARLGAKGFQTPMWDFNVMLIAISRQPADTKHKIAGLDVSGFATAAEKDQRLKSAVIKRVNQQEQLGNPDARVVLEVNDCLFSLQRIAKGVVGIQTGDFPQFGRCFWELYRNKDWEYEATTVNYTEYFGGKQFLIYWQNFEGTLAKRQKTGESYVRGWAAFGNAGVLVSAIGSLPVTLYSGELFDNNCAVILPNEEEYLPAIWCFCSSPQFNEEVRKIDQKLNVTNATLVKIPFDLDYWQQVAAEKYPNGLPLPYSDDPTQWLFHGHPVKAEQPLQAALARLLGYRWPAERDEKMELAPEARELIAAVKAFDHHSDDDGIVCIPSVNAEPAAADRLRDYLREVYGSAWSNNTFSQLLRQEGAAAANPEAWLRDEFFIQHCKVFHSRPFIWHIWDGRNDGFAALANYHQLTRENLQKLIYTYLGDWIRQCEVRLRNGQSGADGQVAAAKALRQKLLLILEGEPPYDVFVRWKPLEEQPTGWDPDLNEGVRLNIYPFMLAGVLRKNPNIKWDKDRGKNPDGAPWGPDRYNRYEHLDDNYKLRDEQGKVVPQLRNEIKRKARESKS